MNVKNPYRPMLTVIQKITVENEAKDLKTFRLEFCDGEDASNFNYRCGQFAALDVAHGHGAPGGLAA